jgi:MinD superfamily P-loop ATPase
MAVLPQTVLLFPELCHGCGACTIICPEKAVSETTRSVGEIFRARSGDVEIIWGELALGEARTTPLIKAVKNEAEGETVIVDCPPGTSCSLVESVRGTDFCLLVTEPTPFGLYDLDIALKVLEKMNIPRAVLVNKSGMGDRKVYEYLEKRNISLLMEIPLDREIAELYSKGEILPRRCRSGRPNLPAQSGKIGGHGKGDGSHSGRYAQSGSDPDRRLPRHRLPGDSFADGSRPGPDSYRAHHHRRARSGKDP